MEATSLHTKMQIKGQMNPAFESVLNTEALTFLAELHIRFNERRKQLLHERILRQEQINQGIMPAFLPETESIRNSEWTVAPLPQDIQDRRVEITGPVDRKMIINALNSGAHVFMADFEDSNTPSWTNIIQGQINLADAIRRTIRFDQPGGKSYTLQEKTAVLMVRPRGWHLEERNLFCDGEVMSGSLVDFGLYFFHNAKELLDRNSGPYFYLPKLESHLEARLWNDVFVFAQDYCGVPQKSIKATVLIETIMASFEMNEILWELKDHSAGLNCGRWDYIFSFIKKFSRFPEYMLPDRAQVTMTVPFMKAYSHLVIQTCHKRNVHAMGGMAAQIPIKNDEAANQVAVDKVKADKLREVKDGHDGTWVAHPGLVQVAMDIFNEGMPTPNQWHNKREDVNVSAADLLAVPAGEITEAGLRSNINVGILYIESWLQGNGAAAIHNLMEDAATAEISRSQVWQWLRHGATLSDGRKVTKELVLELINSEREAIKIYIGEERFSNGLFDKAESIFCDLIFREDFIEFLTLPAYDFIQSH